MRNNIKTVVRAIIVDEEGKVLLGKRASGDFVGKWALVGGRPEEGEVPNETIIREVKEELGVDFDPKFYYVETDKESIPGQFWNVIYFTGSISGEINLNDEIGEVKFVTVNDLNNLDIAYDHKEKLVGFFRLQNRN